MKLELITPPSVEPVSLTDAKDHLRVDDTNSDTLITELITVARRYCERIQNRVYITQTWDLFLDGFPSSPFDVALPPLQSVTSIKYTDKDEVQATFDATKYQVDTTGFIGRISLKDGASWPSVTLRPINGFEMRFVAGYGNAATDVPNEIVAAIKMVLAELFENRQITDIRQHFEIPVAAHNLLTTDRVWP